MQRMKIPEPMSGGLILSYTCNAECRHCMYACSPNWKDEWISKQDLKKVLEGLADKIEPSPYGPDTVSLNHGLHFTGGEPFLNYELLCEAVKMAKDLGIPSTFVETNCFWCTSDEQTKEKLQYLKELGLSGILISVNPFYLEYVPFERTERAIRISQELFKHNLMIYQLEYYRRFKELGIKDRIFFKNYLEIEKREDFARNAEFFIMGRAPYKLEDHLKGVYPKYPARYFFEEPCRPPLLRSWHNHFDNYGNFVPGYCGGISLGDCRDLNNLLQEGINDEENPVLAFLIDNDFKGLFDFAKEHSYQNLHDGYFSKCHLCIDIRKNLIEKHEFKELRPKQFYLNLS